ncbi:MAG: ATP-binding cassette domain-containing protein, partial [Brachybacterium sp.]
MSTPMTGSVPPDHPALTGSLEEGRLGGASSPVLEEPVLSVRDLNIVYEVGEGVHAVKDASFTLRRGEILGLAGESGCGKTTLAY